MGCRLVQISSFILTISKGKLSVHENVTVEPIVLYSLCALIQMSEIHHWLLSR